MTVRELREKYLRFFETKGHLRFPSGSLVPYDVTGRLDESLLFNGAGMIQFKPYFRGVAQPENKRLTTCQKCVRTGDIEEVGDDTHLTFFEMLGNFSFGDYFKSDAIAYSWEFLTGSEWLALDPARLSFTVFEEDDLAFDEWSRWLTAAGITPTARVVKLDEETNYWPAGAFSKGPPGPCGPNSEMFYWVSEEPVPSVSDYTQADWVRDEAEGKWVEIWNDVFIQYDWAGHLKDPSNPKLGYEKDGMPELPFRSIDTGMGLERTALVLAGKKSVYDSDVFEPIFAKIDELVARPSRSSVSPTVSVGSVEVNERKGAFLPHWTAENATYFVTFRLADSVPKEKRQEWADERERMQQLEEEGILTRKESYDYVRLFSERVGEFLDSGAGSCLLNTPETAEIVREALTHFDGARYQLHAWVVMPNHVHAVVTPLSGQTLDSVLHSWKSFTAHEINKRLSRTGDVWMDESYDHLVRNESDFERCVRYVLENPAKGGLTGWPFVGSAGPDSTETVLDTLDRDDQATRKARRVVADHIRTSVFCISDGVLPANTGRGYVLRRLIRRAVLQGDRKLGIHEPFLYKVFDGVVASMGSFYSELEERRATIVDTLRREEEAFRRTLASGCYMLDFFLNEAIAESHKPVIAADDEARRSGKPLDLSNYPRAVLSGQLTFKLYDTYGFPLEVTQELAADRKVAVDLDGYEAALKEAQALSRGAQNRESVYGGLGSVDELAVDDAPETSEFLGYNATCADAKVVRVRPLTPEESLVALDRTPFYAESGGQTGDTGMIGDLKVEGTTKSAGTFWHRVSGDASELLGKTVTAKVDESRRNRIRRNHTATHLLHAALRQVLGTHVAQAGSYVGPDNLRFDFTHGEGMTPEQIAEVEAIVNHEVLANTGVETLVDLPIEEAKARGAMALFGEKYGKTVRMVEVGEFSRELCGGIHVRSTGEIGLFKIVSESSAAGGVRRIEAITGEGAYAWVLDLDRRVKETAALLKAPTQELLVATQRTLDQLKDERKRREKAEMAALSGGTAENSVVDVKGVKLWTQNFGEVDQKIAAQAVDNQAAQNPNQVTVAAVVNEGKVTFIAKVGDEAKAKGAHAGNLLKEVARIAGGGGGGRPDFATAGGKMPEKVDEALAASAGFLEKMLG